MDSRPAPTINRKYWEIIADNLSKAGWSWGCVSAIDSNGRTIWIADAHRGDIIRTTRGAVIMAECTTTNIELANFSPLELRLRTISVADGLSDPKAIYMP
jgi:hypothetical protein